MLRAFGCVLSVFLMMTCMVWTQEMNFPKELKEKLNDLKIPPTKDVLVVSISDQKMVYFKNKIAFHIFDISTALNGYGQQVMSYQTPLGLHRVANKIGAGMDLNTIFKARMSTGHKWDKANRDQYTEDLVLTRILWLEGVEHGVNKGRDANGVLVDSKKRFIYIHGTNQEDLLGSPASMGCIRMGNKSVINLFDKVPVGTLVWIQK